MRNGDVEIGTSDQNPLLLRLRETNEALKESEEKYRCLVEGTGALIFSISRRGRFTFVNEAAAKVLGYTQKEILGRFYLSFMYSEDTERVHNIILKQLEEGIEATNVELRFVNKEGSVGWFVFLINLIKKNGEIIGLKVVAQDITERKRAEEALRDSERRFRLTIENQGEGIGRIDLEEKFDLCNPAAEEIFGVPYGTLIGRNLMDFLSHESRKMIKRQTGERIKGKESSYEIEIIRPDGKRRQVLVTASPWKDDKGNVIGAYGIFRDITEWKKDEQEREKLISELQDALERVKRLKGLIPICASCKKIRDDKGYWEEVEVYIRNHADVEFSHGICPACQEKYYGDFLRQNENKD